MKVRTDIFETKPYLQTTSTKQYNGNPKITDFKQLFMAQNTNLSSKIACPGKFRPMYQVGSSTTINA